VKFLALAVAAASGFTTTAAEIPPDFRWARQAGSSDIDVAYGIALDGLGNVFVTGFFSGTSSFGITNLVSSGIEDIFLAKYDPAGRLLWARKAGGTSYDEGRAVAVDAVGNAYIVGLFQGTASFGSTNLNSAGESDIFIAKYDAAGNLLWTRRAGGNDFDEAYGVALDAAGNAYLTGYFTGPATFGSTTLPSLNGSNNVFVAKCDSSGNFLWARSAGGDADDQGNALAVDAATNIYVTGAFAGTITFASTNLSAAGTNGANDIFIAKYNGAGTLLWVSKAGGATDDTGNGIVADAAGNAYVTGKISGTAAFGSTNVTASGTDLFLAKYDGTGNLFWVRKGGGNNSIYGDGGHCVKLDAVGNPCVAGYFSGTANFGPTNVATTGLDDLFVAKYDATGNLLWVRKAGGGDLDIAYAVDVDAADNICVTGFFVGTAAFGATNLLATSHSPDRDIFVAKLGSTTPPKLAIRKSGTDVLLSWPAPAVEFILESAPGFPAVIWNTVPAQTNITGTSRTFTLPASGPRMFFRLRSPP
jgi:hypothetical protein